MKKFTKINRSIFTYMQLNHSTRVVNLKSFQLSLSIAAVAFLLFLTVGMQAQNPGDFRSKTSGDWYSNTTWESYDGSVWIDALQYPGEIPGNYLTQILPTHVVTIYDTQVANNLGEVWISGQLYLEGNNSGANFSLKSMRIFITSTGSIYFDKKGTFDIPANSILTIYPGGSIAGACSDNQRITIGGQLYAVCHGGGHTVFLFTEIVDAGSTLAAEPTVSIPPYMSCQEFEFLGSYFGNIADPVTYSWSVTGPDNSTTVYNQQNVAIPSPIPGTYTATLTVSTNNDGTIYSNSQTKEVVVEHHTTWTGLIDNEWSNVDNWSCELPDLDSYATIPATSNNPVVTSGAAVKAILIKNGAQVTVEPASSFSVATDIFNLAGVSGILLKSDETGVLPSATLMFNNDISTTPVPATVQFFSKAFIDPDAKWQYFGIPFTEYVPGENLGPYKKYSWDETFANGTHWKIVQPAEAMLPFMGYAITQDLASLYEISGNLTNEDMDLNLSFTPFNNPNVYSGSHIIANSYTAAIPIKLIGFTNMEESVAFYNTGSYNDWIEFNPTGSGFNPGQYLNVPKNLAGLEGLPFSIPSMQGFLVNVLSLPGGTISIPYLPLPNASPLRARKDIETVVSTIIDIKGKNHRDRMWLFTNASCTKAFDNGWDSRKLMSGNSAPQLFFVENDNKFQVSTVDDINGSFLGFRKGVDSEYTITFTHKNTELAYPNGIYLMDLVANKTVNVSENGSTYTFTVNSSSGVKGAKAPAEFEVTRFKLVTSPGFTTEFNSINNEIKVFVSEKSIIFDNQTEKQAQMTLFDVTGKVVMSKSVQQGVSTVNVNVPAGTYIVQIIADRTNIKSSIIIK